MKRLVFFSIAMLLVSKSNAQEQNLKPEIKLYTIDCGAIDTSDLGSFSDTGEYDGKPAHFSDPCFLISHPKGLLLWDTGLPDAIVNKPMIAGEFKLSKSFTLKDQLKKIGLKLSDIKYVSISHSHFDHSGNLDQLGKSTWLLQKAEVNYIKGKPSMYVPNLADKKAWKVAKKIIYQGDYDVFQDGSVKILSTPGHTPGHQSLELKLHSGVVILSGDLFHQRTSFETLHVPLLNTSRAETMASADRIKTILINTGGRLVIQHDENDFNAMPKFPEYLE